MNHRHPRPAKLITDQQEIKPPEQKTPQLSPYMSYLSDDRGAYPSSLADTFIGIEKDQLEIRRQKAFVELNFHCDKRHSTLEKNPIAVATSKASELNKDYLKHLKRKPTPWERLVVQTYCLERESQQLYQPNRYQLSKSSTRCRDICEHPNGCIELAASQTNKPS